MASSNRTVGISLMLDYLFCGTVLFKEGKKTLWLPKTDAPQAGIQHYNVTGICTNLRFRELPSVTRWVGSSSSLSARRVLPLLGWKPEWLH